MESVNTEFVEVIELKSFDKAWWNELVSSVSWGNLYQTSMWADFHQAEYGMIPHYLLIFYNERVVGCCLVIEEKKYHVLLYEKGLRFLLPFLPKTCRIELGPVFFCRHELVMKFFVNYIKKKFKRFYCINPNYFDNALPGYDGFKFKNWGTHLLDIVNPDDALKLLSSNTRKDVKAALRKPCDFFIETDIEKFGKEYVKYRVEEKLFPVYSGTYFSNLKKYLGDNLMIFGLEENGKEISFSAIRIFNGIASDCYSIRKKRGDFLFWKVKEWCYQQGLRIYDFCGFNPEQRSEKEEGIYHFKKKWGGKEIVYKRYSS